MDIGPQKQPSSVAKVQAEGKAMDRELKQTEAGCDGKGNADVIPAALPCPFCGELPVIERDVLGWVVVCTSDNCGVNPEGKFSSSPKVSVGNWNKRAKASDDCCDFCEGEGLLGAIAGTERRYVCEICGGTGRASANTDEGTKPSS